MPRRSDHIQQQYENHDRWLVSYADFITLLFAFFVVMYSISSVNEGKYKVLSQTLVGAFDIPKIEATSEDPISLNDYVRNSVIDFPGQISKTGDVNSEVTSENEDGSQRSELDTLTEEVEAAFADLVEDEAIAIDGNETWIEISLSSELLFQSGNAVPNQVALPILKQIADILSGYENPVHVEGFTDNVPISSFAYPSNWELSAARAATVVRLLAQEGVDSERLAAIGYGEFQPVASNDTVEGRAKNRRVVMVVSRDLNVRRSAAGVGDLGANTERGLDVGEPDDDSFLIEKNRIKAIELEGGGILFTQDDE